MNFKLHNILLFLSFCILTYGQHTSPPKSYIAYKTPTPVNIDGNPNDPAWQKVNYTDNFIDIEGNKIPKYTTKVKMVWDDTYFYILAELEEPHIWANLTKRESVIFHNNDFEVFVDPEGNNHGYYELEINALNTVWDLFISKPYRELNQPVLNDWNITGLKSAIKINGTLNNYSDIDKGWTIELAIPWKVYKTSYYQKNVPKNKFWRVNFSRVNWDFEIINDQYQRKKNANGKLLKEYNWVWSPQGVVNMHEPEKWGYVFFSSKLVGDKESFLIPNDEKIKWKLYELYRTQKKYYAKRNKWQTSLKKLNAQTINVNGKILYPVLENHSQGWNITVVSPFTKNTIVIREDGELIIKP